MVLILCKTAEENIPCIEGLGIIILLSSRNAFSGYIFSILVYTVKLGNKELFGHPKIVP